MSMTKALTSCAAVMSLVMMSGATAEAKSSAANKLALTAAQGVSGAGQCVRISGKNGKWQQDAAGQWLRCGNKGGGFLGGNGLYVLLGLAAVGGGVYAVTSGGPSSP